MRPLLIALCIALLPHASVAQPVEQQQPTPAEVFGAAWEAAHHFFFDPAMNGVDWDAARERHRPAAEASRNQRELSAAINAMLAELNTSHVGHYTPDDVAYYHLRDVFQYGPEQTRYEGLEAWFAQHQNGVLVIGVWPGGNADRAGLLTGDVITAVDGQPASPVAAFRGRAGKSVELTVQRTAEGEPITLRARVKRIDPGDAMLQAMRRSVRIIETDGAKVGYVQILSYAGYQYQEQLLREIFQGRLKDADALLIDLRDGWGGAQPQYLDPFLKGPVMTVEDRTGRAAAYPRRWNKPVGILVNEGSRSGKEVLAFGFREYGLGPVIGERTAGAVVAGTLIELLDGSVLYMAISDVRVDGQRLEGVGVEPTIHVPFDPLYAQGADPQRDKGLQVLAQMVRERAGDPALR